ncbi:PREDICTED: serine protease inhibitor dipetalogastin-like [Priapulus caudatus]|uniref:Serine protease inhibitor dipetalogastin-like n=1 Tax=Priapulus caudatus TaxID=37621 RepID=A0ABM1EZC2_PRICU|nr:PREDICTED: serine protease inhibitor dipetalogastin-like [Priapulus caudatus]
MNASLNVSNGNASDGDRWDVGSDADRQRVFFSGGSTANAVFLSIVVSASVVTTVGNGLVILIIAAVRRLRTSANLTIVNLACCDFVIGCTMWTATTSHDNAVGCSAFIGLRASVVVRTSVAGSIVHLEALQRNMAWTSLGCLLIICAGLTCAESPRAAMLNTDCILGCPEIYSPVCASDGYTYDSRCVLDCIIMDIQTRTIPMEPADPVLFNSVGPCNATDQEFENCSYCNLEFDAVCGTDGTTYTNICELDCIAYQKDDATLAVDYEGECDRQTGTGPGLTCAESPRAAMLNTDCILGCPEIYSPVCASDGYTYDSRCVLDCIIMDIQTRTTTQFVCDCPDVVAYVCGSDGSTYPNECMLNCARIEQGDDDLIVEFEGHCDDVTLPGDCNCDDTENFVCGTDGNTYINECMLNCSRDETGSGDDELDVDYSGECGMATTPTPCTCQPIIRYVCGTDGETYTNECFLECTVRESGDQDLAVASLGPCPDATTPASCSCPRNVAYVCGTDGNTYTNECFLQCERDNRGDGRLSVAYTGQCDDPDATTPTPTPCTCPRIVDYVCGTDGETYQNECMLDCTRDEIDYVTKSH